MKEGMRNSEMNSLLSFELSSVDDNEMGLGGGRLVRWYQACGHGTVGW